MLAALGVARRQPHPLALVRLYHAIVILTLHLTRVVHRLPVYALHAPLIQRRLILLILKKPLDIRREVPPYVLLLLILRDFEVGRQLPGPAASVGDED